MVGDLGGSERFDAIFFAGISGAFHYNRNWGGFLIARDGSELMVPGIASRWGLSADGLTWSFTIRKGVKWHDGSELTPEDVLWTFQHYFGAQAVEYQKYQALEVARQLVRIELSKPDTVSITTKIPFVTFDTSVAESGGSGNHMMPKRAKLRDEDEELAYDKKPIGAGPMKLVKHVRGSVMTFERFEDFYYQPKNGFPNDRRATFQLLDLFVVPEEAIRVAALRAGEADIFPASLATKKQVEAGGGRLVFGQESVVMEGWLMGCWELQYPCHDKRVRQALDYATPKEVIRDHLYGGPEVFQVKGWDTITPSSIGYTPAIDPRPFDPNKARQLLADAGYAGGKGFGKLIVNTWPSDTLPFQVEAAQLVADSWKRELGLDVEVKVGDVAGLREKWLAQELKGQVFWRDREARRDSTSFLQGLFGTPGANIRLHEDPELFRLVQETVSILDPDKREEAVKKLVLRIWDESYLISAGYANLPWAVGPRVLTWQPEPLVAWFTGLHTVTLK
jgi:peptide/nickel transport system substrate-binding protein